MGTSSGCPTIPEAKLPLKIGVEFQYMPVKKPNIIYILADDIGWGESGTNIPAPQ